MLYVVTRVHWDVKAAMLSRSSFMYIHMHRKWSAITSVLHTHLHASFCCFGYNRYCWLQYSHGNGCRYASIYLCIFLNMAIVDSDDRLFQYAHTIVCVPLLRIALSPGDRIEMVCTDCAICYDLNAVGTLRSLCRLCRPLYYHQCPCSGHPIILG